MAVLQTFLAGKELTVVVVNEDPVLSRMLKPLVATLQGQLETYLSLEVFLETVDPSQPGCLLFNAPAAKDYSFAWLERLAPLGIHLPVVILSACGDVAQVVQAMRAGARNYLKKPCQAEELREALLDALAWDQKNRREQSNQLRLQRRLTRLTPGEFEVLRLLVDGKSNRQVAGALGVSVRAVEVRRAKLMQKMKAESLAELVRLALTVLPELVQNPPAASQRGGISRRIQAPTAT